MFDLGGALRWMRDHWVELALGAGGVAAAAYGIHALWKQWSAPRIPADDREVGLSIIVPTLNEEKTLPRLLECIASQKCSRPIEVIVVDGGRKGPSSDGTVDAALAFASRGLDLQVILANALPGKARNVGAAHSKYRHLLFLDADSGLVGEDFLEKMIEQAEKENAMIGGFRQRPRTDSPDLFLSAWYAAANAAYEHMRFIAQAANMYCRRSFFMWLGGFDEARGIGEDMDFCQRALKAGFKLHFFNQVVIWDERRVKKEGLGLAKRYVDTWLLYAGEELGLTHAEDADPHYFEKEVHR